MTELAQRMDGERFEVLRLLTSSVMPLGILTVVVLGVILFGITTATESAGVGAAGSQRVNVDPENLTGMETEGLLAALHLGRERAGRVVRKSFAGLGVGHGDVRLEPVAD